MAFDCSAPAMDQSISRALNAGNGLAILLTFCANALVHPPSLLVAYETTEAVLRRPFLQVQQRPEDEHLQPGTWIDAESFFAFGQAAHSHPDAVRIHRALAQYQVSLLYWNTGARLVALSHLYVACEILTKPTLRLHQARLGVSDKALATSLGVDVSQKNWKHMAEAFGRREFIFDGDKAIYDTARTASDGFEHGSGDLETLRGVADSVAGDLFPIVRSAILALVDSRIPSKLADLLMAKPPVDISPLYKQITGYLVTDDLRSVDDLATEGEMFP